MSSDLRTALSRSAVEAAPALLGAHLVRDEVVLRIVEVEAYPWPGDAANHCRSGRTARNAAMWGPPGTAYVYLCYGLHHLLNVVAQPEGEGAAVLIRGAEVVSGASTVRARRGRAGADLAGPGKVGAALGLDSRWSGHDLFGAGGLRLEPGRPPRRVRVGPRVGIDRAGEEARRAPWRFADADSAQVSHPKALEPLEPERGTTGVRR